MNKRLFSLLILVSFMAPAVAFAQNPNVTEAFVKYFGEQPKSKERVWRGAVTYIPGIGKSYSGEKLSPLPLFSVNPDNSITDAARVIIEGFPLAPRFLRLPRVFPDGALLENLEISGDVINVKIGGSFKKPSRMACEALGHTLTQYPGIKSVNISLPEGPPCNIRPDEDLIESPPPPRIIDIVSTLHEGEVPSEINVLFDRPVVVEEFIIREGSGEPLPGRVYTSMFDMGVIVKPDDPGIISEELRLWVSWKVRDKLGTLSVGEKEAYLRIFRR